MDQPRVLILEARFYDDINDQLIAGAAKALETAGAVYEMVTVPGALELPAALQFVLHSRHGQEHEYDAFVALGCVIRGETSHYDLVCNESARGLYDLVAKYDLAFGNGILTVENHAQAEARADMARKDKGGDAARAALHMHELKHKYM